MTEDKKPMPDEILVLPTDKLCIGTNKYLEPMYTKYIRADLQSPTQPAREAVDLEALKNDIAKTIFGAYSPGGDFLTGTKKHRDWKWNQHKEKYLKMAGAVTDHLAASGHLRQSPAPCGKESPAGTNGFSAFPSEGMEPDSNTGSPACQPGSDLLKYDLFYGTQEIEEINKVKIDRTEK